MSGRRTTTSLSSGSSSATRGKRAETSAAVSTKKPKVDDNAPNIEFIEKFLMCTVCLDFPCSPIHSCDNAHILCGQCAPKLSTCPTCRNPKLSPNSIGEKLAKEAKKKIECPNLEAGCKEGVLSTKFVDHLAACYFREVTCNEEDCGLKVKFHEYTKHLKEAHNEEMRIGPKLKESYFTVKKFRSKIGWIKFQSVTRFRSQEFICHLQISRQSQLVFFWVSVLGDKDLAKKYECIIELQKSDSFRIGNIWKAPVLAFHKISNDDSEAKLCKRSELLAIPMHVIKNLGEMRKNKFYFEVAYQIKAV